MIIIIGGGPAGRIAAMRLARGGKEVHLIEKNGVGGQCLHYGCMVVCALNDVARTIRYAETLRRLGVIDTTPRVSFPHVLRSMAEIQKKIGAILRDETTGAGVEIIQGEGSFAHGSALIDGERLAAEAVVIATGSYPAIPDIEGIDDTGILTPHTLPGMTCLPEKMAIIGCGSMGAEFAHIFSSFGTEVDLICRSSFLKNIDPLLCKTAKKELEGVRIHENAAPVRIRKEGMGKSVTIRKGGEEIVLQTDAVFLAAGLVPRSECIQGLEKGPLGEIRVDDHMQTSQPGVYACGDVTGPPYLTPVARMEGVVAADNILGCERRMDYRWIPQSIGLMNEFAFCQGEPEPSVSMKIPSPAGPGSFWSVPEGRTGNIRVTLGKKSGRIASIAAAAPGAGIIAHYMAQLMRHGCTGDEFEFFVETHPTTDGVFSLIKYIAERQRRED